LALAKTASKQNHFTAHGFKSVPMKNKYPFSLAACLLLLATVANGQFNAGYYRQAEKLFQQKDYYEAQQYYEKFLVVDKKSRARAQPFAVEKKVKGKTNLNPRQEAVYHLADCYRQQHDYNKAEQRFKEACSFPLKIYPESQYWYGVSLRANGKYTEAIEAFTTFEKQYTELGPLLADADRELDNLHFIQQELARTNKNNFLLTRQSDPGHTSSYALAIQQGDTLVFTSIHKVDTGLKKGEGEYRNDLYESTTGLSAPDSNVLNGSRLIPNPLQDGLNNGLASFSVDGKRMFFTRWVKKNGVTQAAIWSSNRIDSGWSAPLRLEEPVNQEGANSTQPFVTTDGKYLLFSSDRDGGVGKYDLWYAELDSNYQPLYVRNMGDRINTPGDEESPYYHQNSRTLIFASNGRVGMGGFDIYYSKGNFNFSQWEKPVNPGIPINSPKDDLYYVSTDEDNCWNTGWLSSDRQTNCCLALYNIQQDNTAYISGTVVDCESHRPLPGVHFTVTDPRHPDKVFRQDVTDSLGQYAFSLKNTSRFELSVNKPGYNPGDGKFLVHMETGRDTLRNGAFCLQGIPPVPRDKEVKDELSSLTRSSVLGNFPYKKSTLPASAFVSLDSLTALMNRNPTIVIQVEGYTDGIGGDAYNIRLAQERVDACIRYLVKKGIGRTRLQGKSFGKCCPIAPDTIDGKDNPDGRARNRRVEYKLVP
jgi:OmpA-OmpF porin, OOP family